MKIRSTLRTLPLVALLATGLAAAPTASMADDDDRGRGKDRVYQKYDGGKGHYRDGHRSHRRDHGYYGRDRSHKKHGATRHVYNTPGKHGHKHHGYAYHTHGHKHHGHRHVDTVVVHDHHDYDPFRLLLGLHFDNIDIIYRDF